MLVWCYGVANHMLASILKIQVTRRVPHVGLLLFLLKVEGRIMKSINNGRKELFISKKEIGHIV
jgi:hypothetical protein